MRSAVSVAFPPLFAVRGWLALGAAAVAAALLFSLVLRFAPRTVEPPAVAMAQSNPSSTPREADWKELAVLYRGGFHGGWEDWGWAARDIAAGQPARVNFSNWGGWIIGNRRPTPRFDALQLRIKAPFVEFLEVRLRRRDGTELPAIQLGGVHRRSQGDGWETFRVLASELNPDGDSYDQIVLRARRRVASDWVQLDHIVLLADPANAASASGAERATDGPRAEPYLTPARSARGRIDCAADGHLIPPAVYGIAFNPRKSTDDSVWDLRAGARRWGGNPTSRYNWRLGNAWNTASDWYFRNVNFTDDPTFSWRVFLDQNQQHGMVSALTIPTLGWVAKDTSSYSFPVALFGPQSATEPDRPDVGNGRAPGGTPLSPGDPTRTSVRSTPDDAAAWVRAIQQHAGVDGPKPVHFYLLDNEPMLWHDTHRDVRREPMGYDELVQNSIAYGASVRTADSGAYIAGPAAWGWPAYFFSAQDAAAGLRLKPDRRAHGDVPLLEWYLQQLRKHEQNTGMRVLDALDVHFYPQGDGVYDGGRGRIDPPTAALRIRSTRALWDPSYRDESWIREPIELLPRLRRIIRDNYPGLGIVIGEYGFGGEGHISGALALAEALGRFGAFEGLSAAFYWTYPAADSPAGQAFKAFRNYDGKGAAFPNRALPASAEDELSLFAARDGGTSVVVVALNRSLAEPLALEVQTANCGGLVPHRLFRYRAGLPRLVEVSDQQLAIKPGHWRLVLPTASITVLELQRAAAPPAPASARP